MTSKIIVNNIGSDSGINTVTFDSNVVRGDSNLHSTGLALGAGSTVGAVTGVTTYYGDGSQLTGIDLGSVTGATGDFSIADKIVHTGDTNTAIRFPAADTITAETSGSERLRIASNGDFGFNDTAPTAHASGNNTVLSLKGKGSSYSGKIDFKDSDGNLDSYINSDNATLQIYCDPNSQNGNTVMTFSVHGSNRMRIGAGGDVDVETGDIFFSTAGKGIVLGNTSNTDANTLDDYEEGTYTPVMKFGGGNTGMSLGNVEAVYTKIGRMVFSTIRFTMTGKGSDTGQLTFEGLPHTVGDVLSTTSVQGGFHLQYLQGASNAHEIMAYPWESTSTLKVFKRSNQNSTTSNFTDSDITGTFDGRISFFYTADN